MGGVKASQTTRTYSSQSLVKLTPMPSYPELARFPLYSLGSLRPDLSL